MKKWDNLTTVEKAQYFLGLEKWNSLDDNERLVAVAFVEYGTPRESGFDTPAAELGKEYDKYRRSLETLGEADETTQRANYDLDYMTWYARTVFDYIMFENNWMQFTDEEKAVEALGDDYCGGPCEYHNEKTGNVLRSVVAIIDSDEN